MGVRNHIRDLRTARDLTQADLAHLVGVTRQTISALENGGYDNPTLDLAFRIACALNTDVKEVFDHECHCAPTGVPA